MGRFRSVPPRIKTPDETNRAHKRIDDLQLMVQAGPQGPVGPQGDPGPQGIQGDPGATGATGLPDITSVTSAPGRALDTNFTPHATRPTQVQYTIRIACSVSLGGSQTGTVELRSDTSTPPATIRDRVSLTHGLGLGVGVNSNVSTDSVLSYLVPPAHNVRLVSSGAATITLVDQTEVVL